MSTKKNTEKKNQEVRPGNVTDEYPAGVTRGPDVDKSFPTYDFSEPVAEAPAEGDA